MPVSRRSRYVTPEELSLWHHMVRDTAPLHGPPAMAADAEPAPIAPTGAAAGRRPGCTARAGSGARADGLAPTRPRGAG